MTRFRSIRWRLMLSYLLLTLVSVVVVGSLMLSLITQQVNRQAEAYLIANAKGVAQQAQALIESQAEPAVLQSLAATASFLADSRVRILDSEARVLADSLQTQGSHAYIVISRQSPPSIEASGSMTITVDLAPISDTVQLRNTVVTTTDSSRTTFTVRSSATTNGSRLFEFDQAGSQSEQPSNTPRSSYHVRMPIGDPAQPYGYVELLEGPVFADETLATAQRAFLLSAAVAAVAAIVVSLISSSQLMNPLTALMTATRKMRDGDLSVRAPTYCNDEIGQLTSQFNYMAEQLQGSFNELAAERDALRRFIADASHELRTPITALKTFNELLRTQAAADASARAEFLAESATQLQRLEWMTNTLLDLSRLQAGLVQLQMEWVPVVELLESAAAILRTQAADQGVTFVTAHGTLDLEAYCDRMHIEMALTNLLTNALTFTPHGGQIALGATIEETQLHLWVQDTGSGILAEDLPHIFKRFYQGHGHGRQGRGLGLAIVKSILAAHDGQVTVDSQPGAGSRFTLILPQPRRA